MHLLRSRPSPALIVAFVALFAALAGGATAAGLISGQQIKNNSLTGKDVRNRSLTPLDFRGSVRGAQGQQGPAGQQGPTGPQGSTGPQGQTGPRGPSNVRQFTNFAGQTGLNATTQVGQLALPAGNHLVFGKVNLQKTATGTPDSECTMQAGSTELDQSLHVIGDALFDGETHNVQGSIAGPTTVTLSCSVLGPTFSYQKVKIQAIQVESIG